MRKLDRAAWPDCLTDNSQVWTGDFVEARQRDPGYPFSWRSDPCYREIRTRLSAMTQAHCAFCDGPVGVESRETVEHFRPKSRFPELAYQWENLFPCCDMCQSKKLERFDAALLKPDEAGYAFERYFVANYLTGAIEPLPGLDGTARTRAKVTIEMYGLNIEARKKARIREWESYCRDATPCLDDYSYRFFLV